MKLLKFLSVCSAFLIIHKVNAQSVTYSDLFDNATFSKTIDFSKPIGSIDGQAGTSPSGAVTYTIPIKLPVGTKGMVPNLSIVYNSQSGNGVLGQGWSIGGLSAISRAGKNIYNNGVVEPISYTNNDAFVLDGSRLLVETGVNGANLATYKTEIESYAVTTSYGSLGGGPSYFNVVTKDGTLMQFGNSDDSRIMSDDGAKVMMWRINKIVDANGNYVSFVYENGDRDFRIKEIKFTGNEITGLAPYYTIKFNYDLRDDKNTAYDGGYSLKSNYLLTSININEALPSLDPFKSYSFWYGKNKSVSYLKCVYEVNPSGEVLNDTRFKYGNIVSTPTLHETNIEIADRPACTISGYYYDYYDGLNAADFDGDGINELYTNRTRTKVSYYPSTNTSDVSYDIYKANSYGSTMYSHYNLTSYSFNHPYYTVPINKTSNRMLLPYDYNGDGKSDIYYYKFNGSKLDKRVLNYSTSSSTSLSFSPTELAPISNPYPYPAGTTVHPYATNNCNIHGDFDGDGAMDIISIINDVDKSDPYEESDGNRIAVVSFPRKGEINKYLCNASYPLYAPNTEVANAIAKANQVLVVDINGDGKSELFLYTKILSMEIFQICELMRESHGGYSLKSLYSSFSTFLFAGTVSTGDFNGDGKTDLLSYNKDRSPKFMTALSNGVGFNSAQSVSLAFNPECSVSADNIGDEFHVGDLNGDGKSDILVLKRDCDFDYHLHSFANIYYSEGNNIFNLESHEILDAPDNNVGTLLTDINSDGVIDFVFKSATSRKIKYFSFDNTKKSQLMTSVTDGFNRTAEFSYNVLTSGTGTGSGDFYTKGTGENYPVNNGQYPINVVTSVSTPDGIGGTNTTYYKYENLRFHKEGRGLLGFEKIKSHDVNADIKIETIYDLGKDVSGKALYIPYPKTIKTFRNSSGAQLSQVSNTYSFNYSGSGGSIAQNNISTVVTDYLVGTTTTTNNIFDGYGNLTSSTTTTTGGPEEFVSGTTSVFVASGSSSIPNRPQYIIAQSKRGTAPEVKTRTTFEYDSRGNVSLQVSKPEASASLEWYDIKEYSYDGYGNVTKEKASNPSTSVVYTTEYSYDAKGRFALETKNTLGDISKTEYHKFWGKPTRIEGVNGLITMHHYDEWGKLTYSIFPITHSSSKTVDYSEAWAPEASTKQLYYTLTQDPMEPDVKIGFDEMGRSVKTEKESFGGAWIKSLSSYDAKGNVASSTNFYLATETPITTTNTYDEFNRIKTSSNVYGTTSYSYSSGGGISTTTISLPDGKVKKTKVDALGKIIESDNGLSGTVVFNYDSRGNEISSGVKVFSGTHFFITKTYDLKGRLVQMKDQDAGEITYKYTPFGQLKEQKETVSGKTTLMTYDLAGRMSQKTVGAYTTLYTYTDKTQNYQLAESQTTGPEGTITDSYVYEHGGRLKRHTRTSPSQVMKKDFSYDINGRLLSTRYFPSGYEDLNNYDANGFLIKTRENMGSTATHAKVLYECLAMNGNEQVTSYRRADGVIASIEYDKGFATRFYAPGSFGTANQDLHMSYNFANGNVLSRTDFVSNTKETFEYDMADRLKKAQAEKFGAGMVSYPAQEIEYDNFFGVLTMGKIVAKSDIGTYKYGGFPQNAVKNIEVGSSSVISHAEQNIEYNAYNKTKKITEAIGSINYQENFIYTGDEDRCYSEQLRNGSLARKRWYLDEYEIQESTSPANTQHIHYVYGGAGLCGMVVKEGASFHYYAVYTDHLGSIVAVAKESTTGISDIVARQSYDAWGRERNPNNWSYDMTGLAPKPNWLYRGYTGHEMLPEYGLINMNGRMYDPANGRMLRPDNFVQDPLNVQSYNRYSYCWNNPLKYTDPSGDLVFTLLGFLLSPFTGGASLMLGAVMDIGGGVNLWMKFYSGQIGSFGDGVAAYSIGAAAGAVGYVTGGAAFAAAGGAAGGAGGFFAGAASGMAGVAFSSPVQSIGNSIYFGDPPMTPEQWATGVGIGAITGGAINGTIASVNGRNFWNGNLPKPATIISYNPNGPIGPPKPNENSQQTNFSYDVKSDGNLVKLKNGAYHGKIELTSKEAYNNVLDYSKASGQNYSYGFKQTTNGTLHWVKTDNGVYYFREWSSQNLPTMEYKINGETFIKWRTK